MMQRYCLYVTFYVQVSGGGFYNLGSEDEAVEHLLKELVPEYIDAVRSVLQFDTFSLYNCLGAEQFSAPEYRRSESCAGNDIIFEYNLYYKYTLSFFKLCGDTKSMQQ